MGWNQISTYQSFGQDTWQHFLIEKSSGPFRFIASVFLFLCYLLLTLEPPAEAKECQEGFVTFVWTQSSDVLSRHIEMWYGFFVEKLDLEPRIPKTCRQLLVFLNARVVRRDMLEDFEKTVNLYQKRDVALSPLHMQAVAYQHLLWLVRYVLDKLRARSGCDEAWRNRDPLKFWRLTQELLTDVFEFVTFEARRGML